MFKIAIFKTGSLSLCLQNDCAVFQYDRIYSETLAQTDLCKQNIVVLVHQKKGRLTYHLIDFPQCFIRVAD